MSPDDLPICLVAHDVEFEPLRSSVGSWRMRMIASLDDLLAELRRMADVAPAGSRTLDLVGHSTREHGFLRIGETAIDACRPSIARLFGTIRDESLLSQIGVRAVRLLGCSTALRPTAQRSLRRLAQILHVPVFGSTKDLLASHYTGDGFNPKFDHILVDLAALAGARRGMF